MNATTLTSTGEADVGTGTTEMTVPRLVVLADAEDLSRPTSSHSLLGVDEVQFRRGDRAAERSGRLLVLAFPDRRMSSTHGRLLRRGASWFLDDPSSKNGTVVDGVPQRRAALAATALLELGHTFLWLASSVEPELPPHLAGDVAAAQLPAWPSGMATFHPQLARTFATMARLADGTLAMLILGETGTGKEVLARAIHTLSGRRGELVAVNCGALPSTLLESELFGHKRGAFSGAVSDRKGLVRSADGGTLFLDEIGELSPTSQAALLRVLQEREVLPVGEDRPVRVDLRVIAATLRDLTQAIDAQRFRSDLYARLAGHVVALPALRERREDLGLLIGELVTRLAGARITRIVPPALRALIRHEWPRNIRELEQVLTAAVALAPADTIGLEHLPALAGAAPRPPGPPPPAVPERLDEEDRALRTQLIELFAAHGGNVHAVAQAMGKRRQQIYKWIDRLGIDLSEFRGRG